MEICKLCAFFEGGMTYSELTAMPITEFIAIIECANEINRKREQELKRGK